MSNNKFMNRLSKNNKLLDLNLTGFKAKVENSYSATSNDIEITVWPEFIDSQINLIGSLFIWAYHVRIDNHSDREVQLLNRHWKIIDEQGGMQEVDGEGVVGEQPKIAAGGVFQYSSGVHLRHPSGIMTGHYQMQKTDGESFEAKIPAFSLDAPNGDAVIN